MNIRAIRISVLFVTLYKDILPKMSIQIFSLQPPSATEGPENGYVIVSHYK